MNLDELTATPAPPKSADQLDDLFSAHNFDIQIDLPSGGDGEGREGVELESP